MSLLMVSETAMMAGSKLKWDQDTVNGIINGYYPLGRKMVSGSWSLVKDWVIRLMKTVYYPSKSLRLIIRVSRRCLQMDNIIKVSGDLCEN